MLSKILTVDTADTVDTAESADTVDSADTADSADTSFVIDEQSFVISWDDMSRIAFSRLSLGKSEACNNEIIINKVKHIVK